MNATRWTRLGLLALTSGVAAVTFAVSFHGLNGYGLDVMRLGGMSPLVPIGVDLASLVALLAAHMRTGERWTRRAYAWIVFATTAGLSVAGNLADGFARGLPTAGLAGVAMAPVVFVLVSHLAITSWRSAATEVDRVALPPVPLPSPQVIDPTPVPALPYPDVQAPPAIEAAEQAPRAPRTTRRASTAKAAPKAPKRTFADTRRAAAALAADGADAAEVARILGITGRQARAALKPVPLDS